MTFDAREYGRIFDSARVRAGYDRMADLVLDMERLTGFRVHENTLYEIKNGKRPPSFELWLSLKLTLGIKDSAFADAVSEEHRDKFLRLSQS